MQTQMSSPKCFLRRFLRTQLGSEMRLDRFSVFANLRLQLVKADNAAWGRRKQLLLLSLRRNTGSERTVMWFATGAWLAARAGFASVELVLVRSIVLDISRASDSGMGQLGLFSWEPKRGTNHFTVKLTWARSIKNALYTLSTHDQELEVLVTFKRQSGIVARTLPIAIGNSEMAGLNKFLHCCFRAILLTCNRCLPSMSIVVILYFVNIRGVSEPSFMDSWQWGEESVEFNFSFSSRTLCVSECKLP